MQKQRNVVRRTKNIPVSSEALRRACCIAGSRAKLSILLKISDGLLGVYIHTGKINPALLPSIEHATGVTVAELLQIPAPLPEWVQDAELTQAGHEHGAPVL